MLTQNDARLSPIARLGLLWRVWAVAAQVRLALWRRPLPDVVEAMAAPSGRARLPTALLSRAVTRGLRIGPWHPRCLIRSLVLYRLLRAQGDGAEVIIGLHDQAAGARAHAWVELAGRDVGPAPGGMGYRELGRYPRAS